MKPLGGIVEVLLGGSPGAFGILGDNGFEDRFVLMLYALDHILVSRRILTSGTDQITDARIQKLSEADEVGVVGGLEDSTMEFYVLLDSVAVFPDGRSG